eukprot:scaffold2079_cov142-Skeletonema_marinoi.AAC.9
MSSGCMGTEDATEPLGCPQEQESAADWLRRNRKRRKPSQDIALLDLSILLHDRNSAENDTRRSKDLYQLGVLEREGLTEAILYRDEGLGKQGLSLYDDDVDFWPILKKENELLSMHISRDSIQPLGGVGEPGRTWSPT